MPQDTACHNPCESQAVQSADGLQVQPEKPYGMQGQEQEHLPLYSIPHFSLTITSLPVRSFRKGFGFTGTVCAAHTRRGGPSGSLRMQRGSHLPGTATATATATANDEQPQPLQQPLPKKGSHCHRYTQSHGSVATASATVTGKGRVVTGERVWLN